MSDEKIIKQIVKNQSSQQMKLINDNQTILRITGLIEDKTSDEMKMIYSKLDSISNVFSDYIELEYTGTTVVALKTNDYLVQSLVNSLGLALILISVIMAFMFRAIPFFCKSYNKPYSYFYSARNFSMDGYINSSSNCNDICC